MVFLQRINWDLSYENEVEQEHKGRSDESGGNGVGRDWCDADVDGVEVGELVVAVVELERGAGFCVGGGWAMAVEGGWWGCAPEDGRDEAGTEREIIYEN